MIEHKSQLPLTTMIPIRDIETFLLDLDGTLLDRRSFLGTSSA